MYVFLFVLVAKRAAREPLCPPAFVRGSPGSSSNLTNSLLPVFHHQIGVSPGVRVGGADGVRRLLLTAFCWCLCYFGDRSSKMPSVKECNNDSEGEEMDQETPESEKTSNEDSDSSSGSEDDSSEMDEEDCERRRSECIDDMADLERQFMHLKEQLYLERANQIEAKLEEVKLGRAPEYLQPLEDLQDNMRIRIEVAGILKEMKLKNIKRKCEAEETAALQNFESERALLQDSIRCELEEKIRRLEEDRNSIDITSDLWSEQVTHKKSRRKTDSMTTDRRKKPVTVSGPYIVYMLRENEILEDWTAIRKALKAARQKND
uniref:Putative breast cancer metastasis-suppressor 1-like a n=1 Tax=Rhipicephalus pulchellus TaxID=72859 RepID=L7M086_RHIPC